jgi:two-component system C4-dicarboxylate transport sensor histidine kinase DctB
LQSVASLRQRFNEWVQSLDPSLPVAMRCSVAPWLCAGITALVFILVAAWLPAARDFFRLQGLPALGCWLLAFASILAVAHWDRRSKLSVAGYGVAVLLTSGALLFSATSLVALSKPPGSAVLAGGFILLAGYCGHHHRVSLRKPFGLLAVAGALVAALAIDASGETLAVFAAAAPAAFGASWLLGTIADRRQRERLHTQALQAAVRAQIVEERARDVPRLSDAMLEVGEAAHDANNAVFTALIEIDALRRSVEALQRGAPGADPASLMEHVDDQLDRLRGLVQRVGEVARDHSGGGVESSQVVGAEDVARAVLRDVGTRYPQVELRLTSPEQGLGVRISGGESSLRCILESLVLNACEGDGVLGARHVEVTLEGSGVGGAAIRVRDDGPGFRPAELETPIVGFQSVKPGASGLGLYTCERLVRASGGSLRRENPDGGGALVTLFLAEGPVGATPGRKAG